MTLKKCKSENCRRKAQKNRTVCRPCRTVIERERDPIKYAYQNKKRNAKRDGIPFTLTLEEFTEFAIRTGYLAGKGRFKHSYHIDRIREWEGYHKDNIQVLDNSTNVRKALTWRYMSDEKKMEFRMQTVILSNKQGDAPF
jgi:hypothetical protein